MQKRRVAKNISIRMYKHFFKRFFDFVGALLIILLLWPLYLIIAILVKVKIGSPVFFKQERVGKGGKTFTMYKFRSMTNATDENGNLLHESLRHTKFGEALRSTSLDELPQLWNVLCGQMSLVGPRPLLPQYLPLYSAEQARRHDVLPGITGWAQVNGRNAISWTEKFKLDCYYVDNISFTLDLKILFLTIKKVFIREGISQEGRATMDFFDGHN